MDAQLVALGVPLGLNIYSFCCHSANVSLLGGNQLS